MKQTKKLSRKVISYVLALTMVLSAFTGLVPGMRLTAYAADTYTVSFNGNQGLGQMNSVTATFGQAMPTVNPTFSRPGYSFAGFYDAANGGTQYYNNSGQSARNWDKTSNTTLYAHWTANKYTVTLNQQGGTGGSGSASATYAAAMPNITLPQRTGYTFGGYFTETNGNGGKYYNANGTSAKNWDKTSNTTLYAYWTAKTYTVTLSDGDGTGGSGTLAATYDANLPTAAIPTKSNYAFAGYYDQENGAGTQYINDQGQGCKTWDKDDNTTLYAHYILTVDKTALNTAITEAETLYNSIMEVEDYSTIASTLKDAIDAAKGVAESDTADQNAVDAAKEAIATAKTNAEAAKKDIDEANKVSTLIEDLPAKEAITKDDKTKVEAAKAAYDALTDDQKKKVSEADKQKLNDAIAAIEKDEADTAAADKVAEEINKLPAADKVTANDKKAIEDARKAYDELTDDQKAKVPADAVKKLEDAEKALAASEKKAAEDKAAAEKKAAQAAMNSEIVVTQKGNKIIVKWTKAKSADGYEVYAQYCGKKFKKPVKNIKKNSITKLNIKKINGKKINLKKQLKVYVLAYKKINGKKVVLAKSVVGHIVGVKNKKFTNVKTLKLKKKTYTVEVGKTANVKVKVTIVDKSKKHIASKHIAKFRYRTSDESIATVSKKGKIKGISKGECTIYVYAANGKMEKATVTVK